MQNLEELQTWLSRQNNIPKKRHRVNTLMDIVGVTHLENNWSDVYAYFFKQHESHGLGRLAVAYGGNSDTVGAIVGSLAEAQYPVAEDMQQVAINYLPTEMQEVYNKFEMKRRCKTL